MNAVRNAPEAPEPELPLYSTAGRILVEIADAYPQSPYRHDYEVLRYDENSSVFWIAEGVGIEDWIDRRADFPVAGVYIITGITGEYVKGDWGFDDDQEIWQHSEMRLATASEIAEFAAKSANSATETMQ
jgi:hypothetical protein